VKDIQSDRLTVREAAAYSRCGIKTLYRAVRNGQLRAARVGGRRKLVVHRGWLDAYLEACADRTPKEVIPLVRAA
jgi:excisionase family DNA binding protein